MLLFLTDVRKVSLNYQKPNQVDIDRMSVGQAERYLSEGHFPPGTMGPKVEGALQFVKGSGRSAIITTPEALELALDGRDGTWITP
jgi:carbamate kinase